MAHSLPERPSTMPDGDARKIADQANNAPYDPDIATKLAWRPAWSIRSRRGAWAAFMALFRKP